MGCVPGWRPRPARTGSTPPLASALSVPAGLIAHPKPSPARTQWALHVGRPATLASDSLLTVTKEKAVSLFAGSKAGGASLPVVRAAQRDALSKGIGESGRHREGSAEKPCEAGARQERRLRSVQAGVVNPSACVKNLGTKDPLTHLEPGYLF